MNPLESAVAFDTLTIVDCHVHIIDPVTRLLIAEVLIHHIDVVRWLTGPLRVVGARAARTIDVVKGETMASILMETADAKPVVVSGMMAAVGFPPRSFDRLQLIG